MECKHRLVSGCAYCHGDAIASLNGSVKVAVEAAPRARARERKMSRAERYAVKLGHAMNQQGPLWRAVARAPQYRPITRSEARWTMNGYGGN